MYSSKQARKAFLRQLAAKPLCYICNAAPHAPNDRRCNACRRTYLKELRIRNAGAWYKQLTPEQKHKRRIRGRIFMSIKRGKTKRQPCIICGAPSEAHHHNGYDEDHAYDVQWLCRKHHRQIESKNRIS